MVMQAKLPVVPITERCPPHYAKKCGFLAFSHSLILNQPSKCSLNKVSYTLSETATLKEIMMQKWNF